MLRRSLQVVFNRSAHRAAFLKNYGEKLKVENFSPSSSQLKPNQVSVQVQYCSLNSNDVKYLEGHKNHSLPHIPGYELSGEVIQVGSDEIELMPGQPIAAIIPERCGGLASSIKLDALDVWPLPSEVSTADAAALICGHATALLAFTEFQPLNEDDTILIIAGAGGFGLAAVDVAAGLFKAKVIALADTEGKACLLRDRGAHAAFKNNLKNNYKEIMAATDNKGVDLIYDAVGGPIINTVVKCLKDKESGAVLSTYRPQDLETFSDDEDDEKCKISEDILKRIQTVSLSDYRQNNLDKYRNIVEQVIQFAEDGSVSAHVSKRFPLDEINEAISYLKGKTCTGKVVIRLSQEDD